MNSHMRARFNASRYVSPQTTSVSSLSAIAFIWAKATKAGDWHPLICHMLDVAATSLAILEREPYGTLKAYAEDLALDADLSRHWVCALAGLHDIGKASPAFQQKWGAAAERIRAHGLTWTGTPSDVPHGIISYKVLPGLLEARGWRRSAASNAADAIGAHHGFRTLPSELARADIYAMGGASWEAARKELFDLVINTLDLGQTPSVEELSGAPFMRMAGLTSFADWIASNPQYFPYHPNVGDLKAYFTKALQHAVQALDHIGWVQRRPLRDDPVTFADVFPSFNPRPLQEATAELIGETRTPTLLLIEAPMGEGKTEAAFYAHVRLQANIGHRGLYVALPTMATGNAMFKRTAEFLERIGRRDPPDLQLQHGLAFLDPKYASIKIDGIWDEQPEIGKVVAREWFTHKKRAMLSEYGVGTIDQALLSVLNVKHQFVRLWGLANRIVVIDEVHAYDVYTSGLIENLVRWLRALGSSVILMSATLPASRRRKLLDTFDAGLLEDVAYPRLVQVREGRVFAKTFESRPLPRLRVRHAPQQVDALAEALLEAVSGGGCVACVVNTVQRAQELYACLRKRIPADVELFLFHARFPAEDRQRIEDDILRRFGSSPDRRPQKAVLVATQVIEQSMDLDFDVLFTDLAPVDLVLQRAGRLHRHNRERLPQHAIPMLFVSGLAFEGNLPDIESDHWGKIYEPYVLFRSWFALRDRSEIRLPDDIEPLVDSVYEEEQLPPNLPASVQKTVAEAFETMRQRTDEESAIALKAVIGEPHVYLRNLAPQAPLEDEEDSSLHPMLRALTRLSEQSLTVVPLHDLGGEIFSDAAARERVRLGTQPSYEEAKRLFLRSVKLSRPNIVRALSQAPAPRGWAKDPLLRLCRPLLLRNHSTVIDNVEIALDPILGIVYRKPGQESQ